ncbi:MAG TPA: alpha/beta hydrolase [Spirochaetota bacterium]|nr:alpha/beta hydrolase [Spirochaetota bacterium]HOM38710.1 alpha/beta hydrolase [Spirochaetota bacterium]HPQ49507.1 alpha/beta hydrolase [Spirochaetota bacterium]
MDIKPDIFDEIEINGVKIHYEYFGKRNVPAIIINNGVAMETASWYQFLPQILEKVDVLLWDFRGQGRSTSDDQPYYIEDFSEYLKAIIDKLELKKEYTNLLGISFGCFPVVDFLRKYQDRVNKAIISGIVGTNDLVYKYQAQLGKSIIERDLLDLWVDSLYGALFSSNFLKTIEPFIPKLKTALFERYKNRRTSLLRLIEAEERYVDKIEDYYSQFKKVQTPILLVIGTEDRLTPPFVQKKLTKVFPNMYIKELEAGHVVYMEKPKEFFNSAIDFIKHNNFEKLKE